ncbi:histidine phosphatase family protein [Zavarzinella formosa]|uniref:histidine phosphatase family protein n=1 Tax=Zavarzinella formosa TaxID=360055 RepID=UPI0002F48012|nr:histidine phosphatase family protein [Zavarzinella formosa]
MTTRVLLIRHGETAKPELFHGYESDIDLGVRGYAQAEALAPVIAALKPDALISSGMLRAVRTAEAISRASGLPLRIEPELHERKVGSLSGMPVKGEFGVWPDTLARWLNGETGHAPEGMESFDDLARRLLPVWDRLTAEFAGKTVAIVAHGIVIRVILLSVLEGYNVADWPKLGRVQNVSVSELTGDGRHWKAARIGEVPEEVRRLNETPEIQPPEAPKPV